MDNETPLMWQILRDFISVEEIKWASKLESMLNKGFKDDIGTCRRLGGRVDQCREILLQMNEMINSDNKTLDKWILDHPDWPERLKQALEDDDLVDIIQHPADCEKVPHTKDGYLHSETDDSPYTVDGVKYCGRCHYAI